MFVVISLASRAEQITVGTISCRVLPVQVTITNKQCFMLYLMFTEVVQTKSKINAVVGRALLVSV